MKEDLNNYFTSLIEDIKSVKKDNILEFIKNRGKLLTVVVLALFLFLGFMIGRVNNTKEHLLTKLEVALKNEKSNKLSSIVEFKGKRISGKNLGPLIEYYSNDTSKVDSLISKLKSVGETSDFKLTEKNKLFGTKYYLELKPYKLKVESEFKNSKFTLDDKNYIESGSSFDDLLPGVYTVKGILESEFGKVESSKDIVVMSNEEIKLDFDAVMLNISSQFYDAEIFINGKATGILVKDGKNIGPLPTDGSVKVHLEKEFPWGRVKGDEVTVKDIPNITLDIRMQNDTMRSEIRDVVTEFYNSVFVALNEEDKTTIKGATEGAINKIYDVLEKKYIFLRNRYEIKEVNIIEDKNQYRYDNGNYNATIVVSVDYRISKNFLGLNVEDTNKMFFTKVLYNGAEWKVEDVENFSL